MIAAFFLFLLSKILSQDLRFLLFLQFTYFFCTNPLTLFTDFTEFLKLVINH